MEPQRKKPPTAVAGRGLEVYSMLSELYGVNLMHLRKNKDGSPAHPLYLPKALEPEVYDGGR